MAAVLGYGGVANTNGLRTFTGKETAVAVSTFTTRWFLRSLIWASLLAPASLFYNGRSRVLITEKGKE